MVDSMLTRHTIAVLMLCGTAGRADPTWPQAESQQPGARASGEANTASHLFEDHCAKCHEKDGTGNRARRRLPKIPDFTDARWQSQQQDSELRAAILEGKADEMPRFRNKFTEEQVSALISAVRAFGSKKAGGQAPPSDHAEKRFRRLEQQLTKLQKESRDLSKDQPERANGSQSKAAKTYETPPSKRSQSPQSSIGRSDVSGARELFKQHCVKCHDINGTGRRGRARLPEIPNFTDSRWHEQQDDPELEASILEGKGDGMPSFRGKVTDEEARALVSFVRKFGSRQDRGDDGGDAPPGGSEKDQGGASSLQKLIAWLGKFHPPVVSFPIALLVAAALAEMLGISTSNPIFREHSRYCVWLGALSAVGAGILGWFLAGFHVADKSWVMTTHRWLGTGTVTWSLVVLLLQEVSRASSRRLIRHAFRFTLFAGATLVPVTGFFGGALVFGLDHYAWPP